PLSLIVWSLSIIREVIKIWNRVAHFLCDQYPKNGSILDYQIHTGLLKKEKYSHQEVRRLQLLLNEPDKAKNVFFKSPRTSEKKVDKYGVVFS
ncbi:hypothetical protein, partial [Oceanobacillus profundus]